MNRKHKKKINELARSMAKEIVGDAAQSWIDSHPEIAHANAISEKEREPSAKQFTATTAELPGLGFAATFELF